MQTTPISGQTAVGAPSRSTTAVASGFERAFEGARVSLSKHAASRLTRRDLPLDESRVKRLELGIDKAAAKGADTSLVLLDELALLVNVPQRLVLTAMSQNAMRDGVVTQIDSAVVA